MQRDFTASYLASPTLSRKSKVCPCVVLLFGKNCTRLFLCKACSKHRCHSSRWGLVCWTGTKSWRKLSENQNHGTGSYRCWLRSWWIVRRVVCPELRYLHNPHQLRELQPVVRDLLATSTRDSIQLLWFRFYNVLHRKRSPVCA